MSIENNPSKSIPVFNTEESTAPKIVGITKESDLSPVKDKKPTPPEFNKEELKLAETTLPGSNTSKELSTSDIKSAVGEVVSELDKNNAWEKASEKKVSFDFDDKEALTNSANKEWATTMGAEIALNSHFEEKLVA